MNLIAIDIGNTNVAIGLFLDNETKLVEHIPTTQLDEIQETLLSCWDRIPVSEVSTERKRNGVLVACSVNPQMTEQIEAICNEQLSEKLKLIGRDVRLPIEMGVEHPEKVGSDRVVMAAAAFAVVEKAVVVADFGTAVTIDLVDEEGVFLGGIIAPGFDLGARALHEHTAQLPQVEFNVPQRAIGATTEEAIRCGLYYSAVGLLRAVTEEFATQLGDWPQLIVTGGAARFLKGGCDFVDNWVPDFSVKAIFLAYAKHVSDDAEMAEIVQKLKTNQN